MQLHTQGHVDVEIISPPLPSCFPNHRRQVVERYAAEALNRLVPERQERIFGAHYLIGQA